MRMRYAIIGVAVLAVGGALALSSGTAQASEPLEAKGVRHGIYHDGCEVFRLEDPKALQNWAMGQKLFFVGWSTKLDAIKEDPEDFLVAMLELLFPDCEWPPSDTARFNGASWDSAIADAKKQLAGFELASSDEPSPEDIASVMTMAFSAMWRKIPKPTMDPKPPMDGEDEPPEPSTVVMELRNAEDFAGFDLGAVTDPAAGQISDAPSTIVVGHSDAWLGWPDTLAALSSLAEDVGVRVIHFSFAVTRELFGLPDEGHVVAYLATAVDPNGVPMAIPFVSGNLASPPLTPARIGALVDYAAVALPLPAKATIELHEINGKIYTVMVHPGGPIMAWGWAVWEGLRGPLDLAKATGETAVKFAAKRAAEKVVAGLSAKAS
jgi:hypothetical protein